ncbi:MAG: helix-turn-helix domain-containing protein [Clostridia bacterium]|nr:helix-turn-helix domain-containing protein [Clostridia bacterium]
MSRRLFQGLVLQMKEAVNRTVGVIDADGAVIACSDLNMIGQVHEEAVEILNESAETAVVNGLTYKSLAITGIRIEYAVFVEGDDVIAHDNCAMAVVAMNGVKQYYDEKYDKATFIKNIMLDNVLPGDIHIKAKELHFGSDVPRAVFLVRMTDRLDVATNDVISSLFPDKQRDFVIAINESDVAIVKEVKANCDIKDLRKIAKGIEDTVSTELFLKCVIGIGTVVTQLKDLARALKEAQVAIDVGRVFEQDKTIINYENLGIGRLIYQLPTTLCRMFLSEVFRRGSVDMLDQETLLTIYKFFENNLNVSETSRKLFVHRNTLVYRLEKIKKITGLDLREFDHAIVFKVALMVRQYLGSRDNQDLI